MKLVYKRVSQPGCKKSKNWNENKWRKRIIIHNSYAINLFRIR